MKKRIRLAVLVLAILSISVPAYATDAQGEHKSSAGVGGKHNFDQWQTIKRLQILH
ncbi:hypothetical protein [Tumebacillus flagellatus]|uniref:hypothetical protein n=1 Tax=Tumebacillus flagellatus TaxID=1157490 RepID=UPI001378BB65|nr:hypothetical protein [Tumebacillus flagellatus]